MAQIDGRRWNDFSIRNHLRNKDAHHKAINTVASIGPDDQLDVPLYLFGLEVERPFSAIPNQLYFALDTKKIYVWKPDRGGWREFGGPDAFSFGTEEQRPAAGVHGHAYLAVDSKKWWVYHKDLGWLYIGRYGTPDYGPPWLEIVRTQVGTPGDVGRIGVPFRWGFPQDGYLRRFIVSVETLPAADVTFKLKKNGEDIPNSTVTIRAGSASSYYADLSWSNVGGEAGYKIYRSANGQDWTHVATVGADVTQYSDGPFTPGDNPVTYYWRVRAYNAAGESNPSPTVSGTIPASSENPPKYAMVEFAEPVTFSYGDKGEIIFVGTEGGQVGGVSDIEAKVLFS